MALAEWLPMTLRAALASATLLASFALAGCAADAAPAAEPSEQDFLAKPKPQVLTNVKVEASKLTWGLTAYYGGDRDHAAGIHAFLFDGEVGDAIVAKASTDTAGTLYILEPSSAGFTVLARSEVTALQGEAKATLRAAGTYALAFEVRLPEASDPNALFPPSFGAALTLAGAPVSPTKKLSLDVRDVWTNATDFTVLEDQFHAIDEKTLPAAALSEWKALEAGSSPTPIAATWKLGNATVYVVESRDDVSLIISFYDATGSLLASATAAEGSEIAWTK